MSELPWDDKDKTRLLWFLAYNFTQATEEILDISKRLQTLQELAAPGSVDPRIEQLQGSKEVLEAEAEVALNNIIRLGRLVPGEFVATAIRIKETLKGEERSG